jgi:acetyl esterase/lipase
MNVTGAARRAQRNDRGVPGFPAAMNALRGGSLVVLAVVAGTFGATPAGAASVTRGIDYDLDGSPSPVPASLGQLDLYRPAAAVAGDDRPIVVYVHGGGWHRGDKANAIGDKVDLFTGAGYLFASVNYRLSPNPPDPGYPPGRVRFPDHPDDVGEAIGWLDRNAAAYGGDPGRIVLIGHSAGAHLVALVSTDPAYVSRWGVDPRHLIGTVPLDGVYDITTQASGPRRALFYNAFATPAENAVDDAWALGSPLRFADPGDPEMLVVTQAGLPPRIAASAALTERLGAGRGEVLTVPYDHGGINRAVGAADDPAGETAAIMAFIDRVLAAAKPPRVKITAHPPQRVKLHRHERRARVRFRFKEKGGEAKGFECRLDDGKFRRCSSPKVYRAPRGRHSIRVRAIATNGDRGPAKKAKFRVVARR